MSSSLLAFTDELTKVLTPSGPPVENHATIPLDVMVGQLAGAFGLGILAAAIHALTCRRGERGPDKPFLATLVLLSVLIALVTVVIGGNIARAFSLVGTLAIVRFRTVVEDTRDTAFVIYAVAAGMCAGSGYYLGPVIVAPMIASAAWIFRTNGAAALSKAPAEALLVLRLAAQVTGDERVHDVLRRHVGAFRLAGLETARGGTAFDAKYAVTMPAPEAIFPLIKELAAVEGVQNVELKSAD